MAAQIDSRISGKVFATDVPLFTTITHADIGPFERNPDFYGHDLRASLTGVSPSNSASAHLEAVTLITPRHCLGIKHGTGYPADGSTVRFCTADDVAVARTISAHVELAAHDLCVMRLDSDVPGTILPLKVLPDDIGLYLPSSFNIPIMFLDQEEKGLVADIYTRDTGAFYMKEPSTIKRREFYEISVAGDSGDQWLSPIGGEFVLCGLTTTPIFGSAGTVVALNQAIVDVDGGSPTGYTVTPISLSGFKQI